MPQQPARHPLWSVHLNAIRGLAALLVVLEHLRILFFVDYAHVERKSWLVELLYAFGSLGIPSVMVFFVLSGYFISASVLKLHGKGRWNWIDYGIHRLTRLYVVLLPALAITALWDFIGLHLYRHSAVYLATADLRSIVTAPIVGHEGFRIWLLNALFLQGIFAPSYGSDAPLWSLSYEFWYYALFPCLVLCFAPSGSRLARLVYACAAAGICFLIGKVILLYFLVWLMGSAVAFGEARGLALPTNKWLRLCLLAFFLLIVAAAHLYKGAGDYKMHVAVGLAFAAFLAAIVAGKSGAPPIGISSRWHGCYALASDFLAQRSYTLYLVHVPLLFILCAAIHPVGMLWQPSLGHLGIGIGLLLGVLLYSSAVWSVTEARTERLRIFVEQALSRRHKEPAGKPETVEAASNIAVLPRN